MGLKVLPPHGAWVTEANSKEYAQLQNRALIATLVLTFRMKSNSELDDRSWTGVSNECKYDGCLQESAMYRS